jgi:hypothetical protein
MKDSIVLILDENAVKRLVGDDPQLKIALKQSVLNNIANSCAKQVTRVEVKEFLNNTKNYDKAIRTQIEKVIGESHYNFGRSPSIKLTENAENAIKEEVERLFENYLHDVVQTYESKFQQLLETTYEKFNKSLNEKIEFNLERMTKYTEKMFGREMSNERLEKIVKDAVLEKLAGK